MFCFGGGFPGDSEGYFRRTRRFFSPDTEFVCQRELTVVVEPVFRALTAGSCVELSPESEPRAAEARPNHSRSRADDARPEKR